MKLADLPATLTVSNAGDLAIGIANISVPAHSSVTLGLSLMGTANRCDTWIAIHAACVAGLVTTSPPTAALIDAWHSAHNYRPPAKGAMDHDGHDDAAPHEGDHHFANRRAHAPASPTPPVVPPRSGKMLDFRVAGNLQYAHILTQI